jgi:ribosomal protein L37AE/L43A
MIHGDIFSYERMLKFKMVNNNKCTRCNKTESIKHQIWECRESQKIWGLFNSMLLETNHRNYVLTKYEELYSMNGNAVINTIKIKIIQEMIQINRPINWNLENIKKVAKDLQTLELYIAIKNNTINKHNSKWKSLSAFLL